MTRLPIVFATSILEDRRREAETLRRRSLARASRAERRAQLRLAKEPARDDRHSLKREPAEIDVIIDLTDRAATSEQRVHARS